MDKQKVINTGLRGVTIASTKISDVNGKEGKLIYRGYQVKNLAGKASYEEVAHLLLFEKLPDKSELEDFKQKLKDQMSLPDNVISAMRLMPKDALPMDVLQSCVALLAQFDPDIRDNSRKASERIAIKLMVKVPMIISTWVRIRENMEPVKPNPGFSIAGNFLYMSSGKEPDKELSDFFDICLMLHAEHSFNASTFATREVASTKAHMYAAVAAGVGSLSGALHGGANTRVMEMLKKIGSVDNVEEYVNTELKEGRKIMGLGHAVYKVDDPRALIISKMSQKMGERTGDTKWYDISKKIEIFAKEEFKKHKKMDIFVNVDFYSASLYYYMDIPMDIFTPAFAASRISGWVTHVIEEQFAEAAPKPAIYRPESDYIGEYCGSSECFFEDIEKR